MSQLSRVEWDGVPIHPEECPKLNLAQRTSLTRFPAVGCHECEAEWTSQRWTHCTNCHRTFGGVTAFDKHQNDSEPVVCYMPLSVGLVLKDNRVYGQEAPTYFKKPGFDTASATR